MTEEELYKLIKKVVHYRILKFNPFIKGEEDDIVNNIFIKLFPVIEKYPTELHMFRIIHLEMRNQQWYKLNQSKNHQLNFGSIYDHDYNFADSDLSDAGEDELLSKYFPKDENHDALNRIKMALNKKRWNKFRLKYMFEDYYFYNLNYDEIAKKYNITNHQVAKDLEQIRTWLKNYFQNNPRFGENQNI